ncbi:TrkA-N domain protein [Flexistipes sinusarabici DSM 4947]|uniref:Trk system potassium uptake protein TrkA n=2 Tax=Flexistipes sinusarabici TaxID=2352 RepID=F8E7R4_FLESM|nr:Trk system potassium transporter TrkA [Flexistipes sinusarabici]AEI13909.1 TrkA-N domain protein [Flexistipes sinusarabici DSM 4947]
MKVIVVGAGEVGYHLAEQLIKENKDVVLIDKNINKVKYAQTHLDCMVVKGEGTDMDIIRSLDIEKDDIFIAVTDSDEVNLITCFLVSSELKLKTKIARVRRLDYSRSNLLQNNYVGVDFVVNPELEAARSIVNTIQQGVTAGTTTFESGNLQLRDLFIHKDSILNGASVKDIRQKISEDYLITGILRKNDIIIPKGDTKVYEGDHLFVTGERDGVNRFLSKSGVIFKRLKHIVIVGGGRTGKFVAEYLASIDKNVKLIEKDYNKCKQIAEQIPDITVIHADISDESIFDEEDLGSFDLMLSVTDNEELNILTSVYAKESGIKKTISLVSKVNYLNMAAKLGIDSTISPKISSANAILKHIRKGNIKGVYSLFDGKAEIIEFTIQPKSKHKNVPIKNLALPKNSLIVAINRNNKNIIPDGNFILDEGDNLILFAKKSAIDKIEEFISK